MRVVTEGTDTSRFAAVVPVADETTRSAVVALGLAAAEFATLGIRIERVLTDNGSSYRSAAYGAACAFRRKRSVSPEFSITHGRRPRSGRRAGSDHPLTITSSRCAAGSLAWRLALRRRVITCQPWASSRRAA